MDQPSKKLCVDLENLLDLSPLRGTCVATDRVMVDGFAVGFMERETPETLMDTGWRFFAGDETEEYLANPANLGLYELNLVANADPAVADYLEAPVGTALERDEEDGFEVLEEEEEENE